MLLSEFSMAISYLRGEDNHLSDQLSRAVQLPDEAFTKAGKGIDSDDRFEMPFAMAWPEVYRQVIQHSNQNDTVALSVVRCSSELCPPQLRMPGYNGSLKLARRVSLTSAEFEHIR
jgi:hypothetical protein